MGGQSSRFGSPKGLAPALRSEQGTASNVTAQNMPVPQWSYLKNLLQKYCARVFFSLHSSQKKIYAELSPEAVICDDPEFVKEETLAITGILSAQKKYNDVALLVVAVDLFFLTATSVEELLAAHSSAQRRKSYATAFTTGVLQPLCAIYLPQSYPYFLAAFEQQRYSITRVLKSMPHRVVNSKHPAELRNVNAQSDLRADEQKILQNKTVSKQQSAEQKLLDARGRPLHVLRLSITDRCNFNCVYCMPDKNIEFLPRHRILSFEQMARVVKALVLLGVRKVKITGGEPTLRIGMDKLIAMISSIDGIEEVALITNGIFLKPLALRLKQAGLKRITVSLDALDERVFQEIVGNTHSLHPVLQGIDAAIEQGFSPIKINCVIQRGINENQILPLVEYFRRPGFHLRFIEYMDIGSVEWDMKTVVSSTEILAEIMKHHEVQEIEPSYKGEVALRYRYADGNGELGFISSVTAPFCDTCDRLRLTADGTLYGCLFASEGKSIKSMLDTDLSDEALQNVLSSFWKLRDDRYSEERFELQGSKKQAMNYIGG